MGFATTDVVQRIRVRASPMDAAILKQHPSFAVPEPPQERTPEALVRWAIETAAGLVSPSPKVPGEHEEFACEDVAAEVRSLAPQLVAMLREEKETPTG